MLEVDGRGAATFGIGDAIGDGWVVNEISPWRVLLSNGTQKLQLLVDDAPPSVAVAPKTGPMAQVDALPAHALPAAVVSDDVARERNREFIEAVRHRP